MWGMEKFRHYLLGRWFIARVDHKPLVALVSNKMTTLTEGWIDSVMRYNFTTEYYPGGDNTMVDAFSRSHDCQPSLHTTVRTVRVTTLVPNDTMVWEATKRGKTTPSLDEQQQLIEQAHSLGHFSTETLFRKIWHQGYWWPHIRDDLRHHVRSCIDCLRYDIMTEGYHPAQSISATQPWDHVEIDLVGPVPTSSEGHTYIFSAADVMSAYVVLKALLNKTMECVARALWEVISEYGTMKILQSDNGTEFVNQVMHELTNMYGIDHRLITPYLPRANGLVK